MADDVKCPQCGGRMTAVGVDAVDLMLDSPEDSGANAASAQKHARTMQAKVAEFGLLYKCGSCGYQQRVKPEPVLVTDPPVQTF